ncbi:MAG: hypothetical protein H6918_12785 [Sphingomonadaceae bacterium]|nr:hypothetical protein [Sphingomonadaceae bacterium]
MIIAFLLFYALLPILAAWLANRLLRGQHFRWIVALAGFVMLLPWMLRIGYAVIRTGSLNPCMMSKGNTVCIMYAWPDLYWTAGLAFVYGAIVSWLFLKFVARK